MRSASQDFMQALGDNPVVTWFHRHRTYQEGMAFALRVRHYPGFAIEQLPPQLTRGDADNVRIPGDVQSWKRAAAYGSMHFGFHTGQFCNPIGYLCVPGLPFAEIGLNVAPCAPDFDGA